MAQKPILGCMDAYNPDADDWSAYVERLELFFLANEIKDDKKVATLLTVFGTKTYSLLRNIIAPSKPAEKTYEQLVDAMKSYVDPKPIVIAERFRFHRRDQREGETFVQYLAQLRKLTEHCEFRDNLEEALRDRLVCGMLSVPIQKRLLAEKDLTLQKAMEIAQSMEAATKQSSELRTPSVSVPTSQDIQFTTSGKTCYRCGNKGHPQEKCHFRTQKCNSCGKQGHIAKVCKASQRQQDKKNSAQPPPRATKATRQHAHFVDTDQTTPDQTGSDINDMWGMFTVNTVDDQPSSCIIVELLINGIPVNMTLDTGASVTIISTATWHKHLPDLKLQPSNMLLKTYTGEPLKLQGEAQVTVCYKDQKFKLPLIVVKGDGPPLLGRDWLQNIVLDWKEIKQVSTSLDGLLQKYNTLFDNKLGTMKGVHAKLAVKPDSKPKFCRARTAPYALREAIEKDLNRLQQSGVVESVKYSDWATPIVPVPKPDGSVRICGDFKVTINPVLQIDKHPIPKPEDLLTVLAGEIFKARLISSVSADAARS